MNNRKLIIIITSKISSPHYKFLQGLINGAVSDGFDAAVFSVFSENNEESYHQQGEEYIYKLINFEKASGVFFDDSSFWCERMKNQTAELIKSRCRVPVLCLNSKTAEQYGFHNLLISDKSCFSEIISHLIEKHGFKNILCFTGTKETFEAEERARGYLDEIKRHSILSSQKNIIYGDFWTEAAKKLANDIITGKIQRPEAIACANDVMAISLINALSEKNIRVPEDIAVTGFDASDDSALNTPSVTTYAPEEYSYGLSCIHRLTDIIADRNSYTAPTVRGRLITGSSCGCSSQDCELLKSIKQKILSREKAEEKYYSVNISEQMLGASDINDLEISIDKLTYILDGYDRFFLCLNTDSPAHDQLHQSPFSTQMLIALEKTGFTSVSRNIPFESKNMLPALSENRNSPDVFFFTPVHFQNKCFGFSAITFKDKSKLPDFLYTEWNRNISAALHILDIRSDLSANSHSSDVNIVQSRNIPIAPHWFFELTNLMSKRENFSIGLPRMLESAHMSQEHLTRVFKKYIGVTPTQYINDLRLEYAAMLILEKDTEIADACFLSGFNTISHFYHQFKKKYGMSPKQYIKKMRES